MRNFFWLLVCSYLLAASFFVTLNASELKKQWTLKLENENKIEKMWRLEAQNSFLIQNKTALYSIQQDSGIIKWSRKYGKIEWVTLLELKHLLLARVEVITQQSRYDLKVIHLTKNEEQSLGIDLSNQNNVRFVPELESLVALVNEKTVVVLGLEADAKRTIIRLNKGIKSLLTVSYASDDKLVITGISAADWLGNDTGAILTVDLKSASVVWHYEPPYISIPEDIVPTLSRPPVLLQDDVLWQFGGLHRLEQTSGSDKWGNSLPRFGIPTKYVNVQPSTTILAENVFVAADRRIRKIDFESGKTLWQSEKLEEIPYYYVKGDTIVVVSGGIFRQVYKEQGLSLKELLTEVLLPTVTGLSTGYAVAFETKQFGVYQSGGNDTYIENVSTKETRFMFSWQGKKAGIYLINSNTGIPIRIIPGKDYLSSMDFSYPTIIWSDSESIFRSDIESGVDEKIFNVEEAGLGEKIAYVLKVQNDKFLVIAASPKNLPKNALRPEIMKGLFVSCYDPTKKQLEWTTRLAEKVGQSRVLGNSKFWFPSVLGQSQNHLFIANDGILQSINIQNGAIEWQKLASDLDWNLYFENQLLLTFSKGELTLETAN